MNRRKFSEQGAVCLEGAAIPFLAALEPVLAHMPQVRAGARLHGISGLAALLGPTGVGQWVEPLLGQRSAPVRATLFDKSPTANWALGWHQDRTIVVDRFAAIEGFGPWTVKAGMVHVEPPFELIERMLTMRLHLDPVDADNGPLRIAPGSHRMGRIPEADIAAAVERCGTIVCPAKRGDIWLYATPILHASHAATLPTRRRVLQIDYSADPLPPPLAWLGL